MGIDREKLNRLLDEDRRPGDERQAQERRAHHRRILEELNGPLLDEPHVSPGKRTAVDELSPALHGATQTRTRPQDAFANIPWQPRAATFDDYRASALREVLARLRDRKLRRASLAAAEPAIAKRVAKPAGTTSDAGQALWRAAERRAATLYRHAQDTGEVASEDPVVEEALQRCGSGHALPGSLRKQMEAELGMSLERVRVHTDAVAVAAARAVRASAFTVGEDIFFAEGAFCPDTREGLQLLAHELTHVVQAYQGRTAISGNGIAVSRPGDSLEREADEMASRVATRKPRKQSESERRKYRRDVPSSISAYAPVAHGRGAMLLRQSAGATDDARQATQGADLVAPATSTKYTYRRKTEFDWNMGAVPAKVSLRWEISRKDNAPLSVGVHAQKGKVDYATQQVVLEKSAKGLDAKVTSALAKANFDLLADGKLPGDLGKLPLVPKVEVKGFEAGLSVKDGFDAKLLTLAFIAEGDFSQLFDASTRSWLEVRGQLRIDCALKPELAKEIVELAKAGDAIKRKLNVDKELARLQRELKHPRLSTDTKRQLDQKLKKLQRVTDRVNKAAKAAQTKIDKIAKLLGDSPGGRFLKKHAHQLLATAFNKFLPIYNVLSTAQDLYEAGKYLAGLDWGSIGDRIVNGGDGGTALSDASHDGGTEGGGEGFGDGGPAAGGDVDVDAIERELEQEANPELHGTAKAVLGSLERTGGDGGRWNQLSKEDKETLNLVIPHDLTPDEIEAMKNRLTTASTTPQDLVTSVIEAVQQVRPLGQQRLGPAQTPSENASRDAQTATESDPSPKAKKTTPKEPAKAPKPKVRAKKGDRDPGTWIIDPAETLRSVIKVDEYGRVTMPEEVEFSGFTAKIERKGVARFSFDTGEEGSETSFFVKVEIMPLGQVPPGLMFRDGSAVQKGVSVTVVVNLSAPRQRP